MCSSCVWLRGMQRRLPINADEYNRSPPDGLLPAEQTLELRRGLATMMIVLRGG